MRCFLPDQRLPSLLGVVIVRVCVLGMACLVLLAGLSAPLRAQVNVLTYHNDNARTGQNLHETILTPGNVNKDSFGLLFTYPVDGYVYAQPLYLSNVSIPGKGTHNVVYVATEHDSVYAFDADDNTGPNAAPLWRVSLIPSGGSTVTSDDVGTADVVPEIGITGTPVIDGKTGTLYVVAKTKENGSFVQRLHALDVQTGAEKFGGPVVIQGSTQGTGDGSSGGVLPFSPWRQHQRAALLLLNGIVYIAWAAHGDNGVYHGWIMGYDAATLQQKYVYCASPNAKTDPSGYPLAGGGIWQAGAGPAADAGGNIYFMTGNGTFSANLNGGRDYGDSFVKVGFNFRGLLARWTTSRPITRTASIAPTPTSAPAAFSRSRTRRAAQRTHTCSSARAKKARSISWIATIWATTTIPTRARTTTTRSCSLSSMLSAACGGCPPISRTPSTIRATGMSSKPSTSPTRSFRRRRCISPSRCSTIPARLRASPPTARRPARSEPVSSGSSRARSRRFCTPIAPTMSRRNSTTA